MGKYWYARVSLWDDFRQSEKLIPLKTTSESEALERKLIINKHEKYIKKGINITFPWENGSSAISIKRYTMQEAVTEYITKRRLNGIRDKTISIYQLALNHLIEITGKSLPIKSISTEYIDRFVEHFTKQHSNTTININLRAIKTFLQWNKKRGLIENIPIIEQILCDDGEPLYLSDFQFGQILAVEWLSLRYKDAFVFYRETGCRLREPFFAKLNKDWMEIPKEYSKNRKARFIQLNDKLIFILKDMKAYYNEHPTEDRIKYYSKQFQKTLHYLGIKGKKLHSLRHTYCVRRIIQTNGDIFSVRDEMGHKSVTTTERYAKIDRQRLCNDFPSLFESSKNEAKIPIMDMVSMDMSNPIMEFINGKLN